jgi:integrase
VIGVTVAAPERRYVDTPTRYEGVFARHKLACALAIGRKRCTCTPSYYGIVWDPAIRRNRRTKRVALIREAKNLRDDLQAQVRKGTVTERPEPIVFEDAKREFIKDCRDKVVLNKHGKPYTGKAITNLDSSLNRLPESLRGKRVEAITSADFQHAVDGFRRDELSSSRIGAIVNAARSFYRWAVAREKAVSNAAELIRLPAPDSTERDRVATPGEFAFLLDQLDGRDALPYAIAGYGTARLQEIQFLEWPEVDFENDVMLLAGDEDARKSEAARRIVPLVRPLRRRLYAEWVRQGRPDKGKVCPPRRASDSGLISLNTLSKRVAKVWKGLRLIPIGLQDSRHTAATWLDHARVAPKVASVFMGHKAPRRQPDAAPITLRRYTHVLPGELERAKDSLDEFLATRCEEESGKDFRVAAAA